MIKQLSGQISEPVTKQKQKKTIQLNILIYSQFLFKNKNACKGINDNRINLEYVFLFFQLFVFIFIFNLRKS